MHFNQKTGEIMKLTADQINHFDEIGFDKHALDLSFKVAMTHHTNKTNEILSDEKKLWDDLIEQHDLDETKIWTIKKINGSMMITEKE